MRGSRPVMARRWSFAALTILCGVWFTADATAADPVPRSSPPASGTLPMDPGRVAFQPSIPFPSAQPIGSYANGCIRGAQTLPPEGLGYQAVNLSRNRNHGHPDTIAFVESLARRAQAERLGRLAIGDISKLYGGRMESGHASHQIGLDVDVWFDLDQPPLAREARERTDFPTMVNRQTQRVLPERFGPRQARLLQLAATSPKVARVFVNPAIKLALCQSERGDRSWLNAVRPWAGHDSHFHVRMNCPAGSTACIPQAPIPPGDGCGQELLSWFEPPKESPAPRPPKAIPEPPAACLEVLAGN
ncbi:penicillin-insensitive murein endopeptidase (plasmid) [Azospirillum brasilense]|uniref:Penicillin-insensitive murein endopeptidase n=1 Tax=Azospirillum brasilense TaxID=192 RepID=A0A4D8R518_AZOBR|nr:penicillin-insensitive murein endopeptidase [Azospirillum brasilense]